MLKRKECTPCHETFSTSQSAKNHRDAVHLGLKPFACDAEGCDATFARAQHLKMHQTAVHLGLKPFACDVGKCTSAYTQSGHLWTHIRKHHEDAYNQIHKKKEHRMADVLTAAGIPFTREHKVAFDCFTTETKYCKLDFLIEGAGSLIAVECDEYAHVAYDASCDTRRMCAAKEALVLGGCDLPLAFVRFNPDPFTVNGETRRTFAETREARLVEVIRELMTRRDLPPLSVKYLFYSTNDDGTRLDLWDNEGFDPSFVALCERPVIM